MRPRGVQRYEAKPLARKDWHPLDLPKVRERDIVGRVEAIAGIVASAIFLVQLNTFLPHLGATFPRHFQELFESAMVANLPWLGAGNSFRGGGMRR